MTRTFHPAGIPALCAAVVVGQYPATIKLTHYPPTTLLPLARPGLKVSQMKWARFPNLAARPAKPSLNQGPIQVRARRALRALGEASTSQISEWTHPRGRSPANADRHPIGGRRGSPGDVLASETIAAMHLSGMRPAPKLARGQLRGRDWRGTHGECCEQRNRGVSWRNHGVTRPIIEAGRRALGEPRQRRGRRETVAKTCKL